MNRSHPTDPPVHLARAAGEVGAQRRERVLPASPPSPLQHCRRGVAAIEFALAAPFLLLAMLAGADLSLFIRIQMNLDQTSTELAQTVTQYPQLYNSDFTTLFNASQTLAGTTPVTGLLGATIISGIVNTNGRQTIAWQQRSPSATF